MNKEKIKNISFVIMIALLLSVIPVTLLFNRDSVAEMSFPVEAIIKVDSSVNIRSAPATDKAILGSIKNNEEVLLLDQAEGQAINGNTRWYQIDYKNIEGFISAEFVELKSWTPELPPNSADPDFEAYLDLQGFPISYRQALHELHARYPNWEFKGIKLNSGFAPALNKQYKPDKSINYVPSNSDSALKSASSADFDKDTGSWKEYEPGWTAASKEIIAYQMDPRNFLNETNIFMFESLSYNEEIHDWQGVRNLLENTFMDTDGYADIFIEAAKLSQVSPYHLISRVKIEVSPQGSDATSGTYDGLEGYYNFFNIGAYGSASNPLENGLFFAKDGYKSDPEQQKKLYLPWTSPEKAIKGGAVFLGADYINNLQNSIYFQKFDLRHDANWLHQYMANIFAPETESKLMHSAYLKQEKLGEKKEFLIPIFASIPEQRVTYPDAEWRN
ncbi:MAG TPA: SH3 domain-containing protein [Candidatus Eisenbacteria bacterium]|nr:SH3 domain-containing protein [Candidatus Eisenbacteria bacterium]